MSSEEEIDFNINICSCPVSDFQARKKKKCRHGRHEMAAFIARFPHVYMDIILLHVDWCLFLNCR